MTLYFLLFLFLLMKYFFTQSKTMGAVWSTDVRVDVQALSSVMTHSLGTAPRRRQRRPLSGHFCHRPWSCLRSHRVQTLSTVAQRKTAGTECWAKMFCYPKQFDHPPLHPIPSLHQTPEKPLPSQSRSKSKESKSVKYVLIRDASFGQKSGLLCIHIVSAIESKFIVHFSCGRLSPHSHSYFWNSK